ncbi:MAG: bacillithiol biosynthesis cysteine-adding enzyme BshC, partial [Candidatus Hydrogenedentales bacterium]
TGQQPAIFTGPLYTIYKAITTLKAADELERRHGKPVVPIFWVGSEDHDFEEARRTHFLTKDHRTLTVDYAPQADIAARPMYRVPLEGSLRECIDRAADAVAGSECRKCVREALHETFDAADSLSDWTARLLAYLFRDTRLLFYAPHLPQGRRCAAAILEREIRNPSATTACINDAAQRLDAAGFPPQLVKQPDECNFFIEVDGRRRKVVHEGARFTLPETRTHYSERDLLDLLIAEPERFSPNVALRCVVQQHLFPVAAYVAGPGELAYWAELKEVFGRHELPMPIVYPRARAVLTTVKLNQIRERLGVDLPALMGDPQALHERVLRFTSKSPAYATTQKHRPKIDALLDKLAREVAHEDAVAANMVHGLRRTVDHKLARIERRVLYEEEVRNGAAGKQLERLRVALAPERKPQERYYNVFSFLFEQGWELIPRLIDALDIHSFDMTEVELAP